MLKLYLLIMKAFLLFDPIKEAYFKTYFNHFVIQLINFHIYITNHYTSFIIHRSYFSYYRNLKQYFPLAL